MRARAVIGANFGDEGKGLVTDWLCSTQGAGMVVRFNGGAQAGHTVVTPDGHRHVFSHFGSGTLVGVPTFLSQFFVLNPLLFFKELEELINKGFGPTVYAHPNCLVTTFADMIINQTIEDERKDKRHGSVGIGFNETINRSDIPELKITMSDLWNRLDLKDKLNALCTRYAKFRMGKEIHDPEKMILGFIERCEKFADIVSPLGIQQCPDPVFEGAQGLLLDQDNKEFFPHLTRSHTGMQNVRTLCGQAGIDVIEPYYVTRTYLTRHGHGPLPGQDDKMSFEDDTNLEHPYQGKLRFAPLDPAKLYDRIKLDAKTKPWIVMTHGDQLAPPCAADFVSTGPTREDIQHTRVRKTA